MRWDGPLFGVVWLRVKRDRDIPTGNMYVIFEAAPSLENQRTHSSHFDVMKGASAEHGGTREEMVREGAQMVERHSLHI